MTINNFVYCRNCVSCIKPYDYYICDSLKKIWYDTGQSFELKINLEKDGCTFGTLKPKNSKKWFDKYKNWKMADYDN